MPSFSAEERQLLDDSLRDFLARNYGFERWRTLARGPETEGFGRAEWARYAELGWLGVALPECHGGAGGGMTELGIVMAGAGRHLVQVGIVDVVALDVLQHFAVSGERAESFVVRGAAENVARRDVDQHEDRCRDYNFSCQWAHELFLFLF